MHKAKGFTLVELIAVIVILGILAVSAIPQFLDLRVDARNATAAGVGGALAAASATNYAEGVARGSASAITSCQSTFLATRVGGSVSGATLTVGGNTFSLSAGTGFTSGSNNTCTITHGSGTGNAAQTFLVTGCANVTCS